MSTVAIGCKLPHGLTFKGQKGQNITLNGMNTTSIIGGHGITHVDENEAAIFFATHSEYAPVKSKAIFYNKTVDDLNAQARELVDEKTGFEGLNPSAPTPGMKPEDGQVFDDSKLKVKRGVVKKAAA